ncbi:MAG: extracellular solute-binding protein [bacterium]
MFKKILSTIKVIILIILVILMIHTIISRDLFWTKGMLVIPDQQQKTEEKLEYKDEQGRIIVKLWGLRSDPDDFKFNATSPVRGWKESHKIRLVNQELIQKFEKTHPHIKIVVVQGKENYDPNVFATLMGSGKGPSAILQIQGSAIGTLAPRGYLANLDEYVKNWDRLDDYWPIMLAPQMYANHYYALPSPYYNCISGLIYRKDYLIKAGFVDENGNAKPPQTWLELAEYGQKLRDKKDQIYGLGFDASSEAGGWNLIHYFWQSGTELVKKENSQWKIDFNNENGIKALQYIKSLKWKYNAIQPDILANTWGGLLTDFRNGKIAMFKAYDSDYFWLIRQVELNSNDVGFAALPAGPAGSVTDIGGYSWIINASLTKEQKDATWKFLSYLADEKQMIYWLTRLNELNARMLETGTAFKTLDITKYIRYDADIDRDEWRQIADEHRLLYESLLSE